MTDEPVARIEVRSRHLQDYVLFNTADGTRWRPARGTDGAWTWTRAES